MPDKIVEIPGVGNISFPDTMSQDDIDTESAKIYKEKQGAFGVSAETPALSRFVDGVVRANPVTNAVDFGTQLLTDPKAAGAAVIDPMVEQMQKAVQAHQEGRPLDAVGHMAGAIPLVGPYVASNIDRAQHGDVAGALGELSWLLAPGAKKLATAGAEGVVAGAKAIPALREPMNAAADALDSAANERFGKFAAPQVGAIKTRLGNAAVEAAPTILRDPALASLSRRGFANTLEARFHQTAENLDAAADARLVSQQVKTTPLLKKIDGEIAQLTAQPVTASRIVPEVTSGAVREVPLDPLRQYALRWMKDEMENFPFTKRTWNEAPRKSGNAAGGDAQIVAGAAGAPIYQRIIGEGQLSKASRGDVLKAINDAIAGKTDGKLRELVIGVADDLARGDQKTQRMMLTPGPEGERYPATSRLLELSKNAPATMPARAGRPLGQAVEPAPNSSQIATLRKIRSEVAALGPIAPYEAIRRIRQAWDKVAKVKYLPATAQDALASQGDATGAMKGTGALREGLAQTDTKSAEAYAQYHVYRSANDVVQAAEEADRVRPNRGRGIMARTAGALATAAKGGNPAAMVIGGMAGAIADKAAEMAPTVQLVIARRMAAVADALRTGDTPRAQALTNRIIGQFPAVRSGLKLAGKGLALAGRDAIPARMAAEQDPSEK
jgi:hypothetical protein